MLAAPPYHALVVHLPVTLIPAAALCALLVAARPAWLRRFGGALTGLSAVAFVSSILATQTGEALQERLEDSGETITKTLHDHGELGEQVRLLSLALFVVIGAMWIIAKKQPSWAKPWLSAVLRGLTVAVAVLVGIWTYRTGHTGASSVWAG